MDNTSHLWGQKNASLSDKSAEKEYGITRKEIYEAVNAGELQFREACRFTDKRNSLPQSPKPTFARLDYIDSVYTVSHFDLLLQ